MEHSIINKTWSLALSACLSDGWKIDSRIASSDVGKGSKLGPIPFSAAPIPRCLSSCPGSFVFPLPQPPFLSLSSQLHTSLSVSLPASQSVLSLSLPYQPLCHLSLFCSFLSWLGTISLSLSLSPLSQHLPLFLSVPFHCILISSVSWGFLQELLMKPPSPSRTMSAPGYLPIPGNEGVPGRGQGSLLFQAAWLQVVPLSMVSTEAHHVSLGRPG